MQRFERTHTIANNKSITFTPADWKNPTAESEKAISVVLQYHVADSKHVNELNKRARKICEAHQPIELKPENQNNFHITIVMLFPKERQLGLLANILASIEKKYHSSYVDLTLNAENDVFGPRDKKFPVALFSSIGLNAIYHDILKQCEENNIACKKIDADLRAHVSLVAPLDPKDVKEQMIKEMESLVIPRIVSCSKIILTYKDSNNQVISLNSQELVELAQLADAELNKKSGINIAGMFAQQTTTSNFSTPASTTVTIPSKQM